jgi:hypothetical protein
MAMRRQICERAVFDGSADDPRVLVHWYQQRMRAQLMASVAIENAQPVVVEKPSLWSTWLASATSAVRNLRPAPVARPALATTPATVHAFRARRAQEARPAPRALAA